MLGRGAIPDANMYDPARSSKRGDPSWEVAYFFPLTLGAGDYDVHGEFTSGSKASSVFLPEFTIDVAALFASARSTLAK